MRNNKKVEVVRNESLDGVQQSKQLTLLLFLSSTRLWSCFRIRKLPKALKEWQAFLDLKKTIDDFSECCPLLEMMAHKAMKQRHWERISTITSVTLDVESETFQLRQLMSAPLLPNKEDIEVEFHSDKNAITDFVGMPWAALMEFVGSLLKYWGK